MQAPGGPQGRGIENPCVRCKERIVGRAERAGSATVQFGGGIQLKRLPPQFVRVDILEDDIPVRAPGRPERLREYEEYQYGEEGNLDVDEAAAVHLVLRGVRANVRPPAREVTVGRFSKQVDVRTEHSVTIAVAS